VKPWHGVVVGCAVLAIVAYMSMIVGPHLLLSPRGMRYR